ncbi:MAG: hypothetical protein ACXWL2_03690 [Candidatus Chromulinivorax sp.]
MQYRPILILIFIELFYDYSLSASTTKKTVVKNTKTTTNNSEKTTPSANKTKSIIVTRDTRNILPKDLALQAQESSLSILKPTDDQIKILYKNYPQGSQFFSDQNLAQKFNLMIKSLQDNPQFIEFMRKIYIQSLNQLYDYLMKIYTNFNLINPGYEQTKEKAKTNVASYFIDEKTHATNEKKLLMNHFINLIQNQFKAAILSYVPTTPVDMAVPLGKMFIENDCGINLNQFLEKNLNDDQKKYMIFLQQYIDFFDAYTATITQFDDYTINQYYKTAQAINTFLYGTSTQPVITNYTQDPATGKTNPSMFFYDIESVRSILFIPSIANNMPQNSKSIPWCSDVIQAATKKTQMNGHDLAYFKDVKGNKTYNSKDGVTLYLLTDVGPQLFEQEILAQPDWMNNFNGNIAILQACLGNIKKLVDMNILDTNTENIIKKALAMNK